MPGFNRLHQWGIRFWLLAAVAGVALLAHGSVSLPAASAAPAPGFVETTVFSGLTNPTVVRFAADGRVFVAEKSGLIKVYDNVLDPTPTTFADLRTNVHNFWDRGLLGMALHPNFPTTPYVYVLYAYDHVLGGPTPAPRWGTPGVTSDPCPTPPGPTSDGCVVSGRLSRLQAAGNVMTGAEQVLVEDWCQQYPSHSVGTVDFGHDGALYASAGDGASFTFADYGQDGSPVNPCGDPPGGTMTPPTAQGGALRSQDVRTTSDPTGLDGSIIRVDPTTGAALPDNPLAGSSDANTRRIIAHGLRNPFRFTFRPGTNELWIGDVGWSEWEEINRVLNPTDATVENFGWPCYEGNQRQSGYDGLNLDLCESLSPSQATNPFHAYHHNNKVVSGESCPTGSSSISGLSFEFAPQVSSYPASYQGALFFSDYSRDCIWAMRKNGNPIPSPGSIDTFVAAAANPVHLEFGPDGNLYYADFDGGTIRKVAPSTPPPTQNTYLSDLTWSSMANGWGPVERDRANGEQGTGDGGVLTLNGTTYTKGLGAHAASDVRYVLGANCTRFKASIGVDDEVGAVGSVTFEVYLGATKVYDSGLVTGASATKQVDIPVTGSSELRLVVTNGGDNANNDHGDWALARVECGSGSDTTPPSITATTPTSGATGVAVGVSPTATFSEAMNASTITTTTFTLVKQGQTTPIAATVSYASQVATLDPTSDLEAGTTYVARVRGGATGAKDLAGNALPSDVTWSFTTASGPNGPPTATIDNPASTLTWRVGDTISFSGHATDPEQGTLPPSALSWRLLIQHCPSNCHSHTVQSWPGAASGSFSAPDHEYPSHLELELTATDASGATDVETVQLQPQTVVLSFATIPSGLQLSVNATMQATPFTRTVIVGSTNSVSAPSPQTLGATSYDFVSWSDGGAQTHNVVAPASPSTLTAAYAPGTGGSTSYLSDLTWTSMTNGWGPAEKDTSNGESAAGDGAPIRLNGTAYAKGLGVHAASDIRYALAASCTRFKASVGVDDEVGSAGSVVLQVFAGATKVYDSGLMTGTTATKSVDVSIAGASELRLIVTNGGNGVSADHADWALARIECGGAGDTTPPTVTETTPAAGATGVATAVSPTATFSEAMNASTVTSTTFVLMKQGETTPVAANVTYVALTNTATLDPTANLEMSSTYIATVKGGASGVKDVAGNALASDFSWTFTTAAQQGPVTTYVSDLTPTSATNGWGPVEEDMSNGENASGDGDTLSLNGTTYAKGLGVHAASDVRYAVGPTCTRFKVSVGVDDEVGNSGSVTFEVYADATKVFDSGPMTGASATVAVDVSIAGASELRLVVTNGGDNANNDHGDWADARIEC